jgi:hypothetical protein
VYLINKHEGVCDHFIGELCDGKYE